ncbi:hypothetical protein [Flavobacterium sp.]|uniref:hypothetical protein n=1 Tax=Flavobacterium sp. TaxID=239 RepID=UPI002FDD43FB
MNFLFRWFIFWLPMIPIAVVNGTIRDLGYAKYTGALIAHQIASVVLIAWLGLYMYFIFKKHPMTSTVQSLLLGIYWMLLTVTFEFGLGYASGKSFNTMMLDYHIEQGRLWICVLVWIAVAPYFFFIRKTTRKQKKTHL